ncbi:hypothetical protein CYLTODRAFT_491082 [Cylindrobasidium torrendii FP15055 ss-10]|uniref:BTB domain-containing protein n=1 Tax=Cylindrobasidium torrendii FP15055 ss-10 TaxID=1314674 RepID=A0A0D7B9T6_9AGAR|nr:hypothetical protein CYLTODRAFT_491082 [Cylindrobasidium torrendii FP15055 ss-10]
MSEPQADPTNKPENASQEQPVAGPSNPALSTPPIAAADANIPEQPSQPAPKTPGPTPSQFPVSPPQSVLTPSPPSDDEDEDLPDSAQLLSQSTQNKTPRRNSTPKKMNSSLIRPRPLTSTTATIKSSPIVKTEQASQSPVKPPPEVIDLSLDPSPPNSRASTPQPPSQSLRKRKASRPSGSFSTPRSKRARNETYHEDHLALDGNIIIVVGLKKFRLHRSVLAEQSTYLKKEVFPREPDDTEDKIPLYRIKVPNLTAQNFAALLNAIKNAISFADEEPEFDQIASILEASHALKCNKFYRWATRRFEKMWPQAVDEIIQAPCPNAAATISLARTCKLPVSVQKCAMYELVRRRVDYSDRLSKEDLQRLNEVQGRLTSEWACRIAIAVDKNFVACGTEGCVSAQPLAHHDMVVGSGIREEYFFDPVCGLEALSKADWKGKGWCEACVLQRQNVWRKSKERLWKDLDGFFGLA